MNNIKWQIQNKNERYIFTINKPNIMKKPKYHQKIFYCLQKIHMHFGLALV